MMDGGLYERVRAELQKLEMSGAKRRLPEARFCGTQVIADGRRMLNLSSNDYLGLSSDISFQNSFLEIFDKSNEFVMSSCSSRLLTGNFSAYGELEHCLSDMYGRAAVVFSSGYHANSGILPAITDSHSLILADKLVHASIIDGLRLSKATVMRYAHNNYEHLCNLLQKYAADYREVIIVTESIFSMDGDIADLRLLVGLKRQYANLYLYVDEAHAFGVRGEKGLGVCEETGVSDDIDFLVGTFGKAAASFGAFLICAPEVKDYMVNKMRTLIYTTALPPFCIYWTLSVLKRFPDFGPKRGHLKEIAEKVRKGAEKKGYVSESRSHIIPIVAGSNDAAIRLAQDMQNSGFYVLPLRPPTVPEGTSRLRLSLTAAITLEEAERFVDVLPSNK